MKKYRSLSTRFWCDESGLLSFEWILLMTLLVIGIVGGTAFLRDSIVIKFGNFTGAVGKLDQSCGYNGCPYLENGTNVTNNTFTDTRAQSQTVVTVTQ